MSAVGTFIVAIVSMVALASAATTAPTTNPAILDAQRSVRAGRTVEVATRAEWPLGELAKDFSHANPDELTRLATLREFGRFFARLKEPDEGTVDALAWLLAQPRLAPTLMMAVAPFDPPERVAEVLRSLRGDYRTKLEEYANLAAAVCVVWDAPERFPGNPNNPDDDPKIDPARVCRIFGHFVDSSGAGRLTFDARRLPPELLVHVVDLDLSDEELAWLGSRRGGARVDVPNAFASIKYFDGMDYDRARKTGDDERAYVLPNILKRGGSGADIAYAVSQIARSAGTPAVVCRPSTTGGDIGGIAPVWVGYAFSVAGHPAWDFSAARYPQDAEWPGEILDPQTNELLGESDVAIVAGLESTPVRERLASMALVKSVDLVPADRRVAMLCRAIDLSPANRRAWFALADLAAAEKFDDAAMKPIDEAINRHLKRLPEFATSVRLRALKGRGTIEFEHLAKRAADAVADRPDVARGVRFAVVDRMREDKKFDEAMTMLTEILRAGAARSPAAACAAMARVDAVLRQQDDIARLAGMYADVFESLPRPAATRHGRTTGYYRIGAKFADVLDELHKPQEAQAIRVKISNVVAE